MSRAKKCQVIGWGIIGFLTGCSAMIFAMAACQ